ncbi:hypothetical protein C8Q70DRAFT_485789 [Cubamyces menziesii]|nr:hypothetical protein C8Q70DRAFT_485789 [Cubamyces menziesii]
MNILTLLLPRPSSGGEGNDGDEVEESYAIDDEATASLPPEHFTCQQYVVYSPTFQVPTFYFTLHDPSGSPLPLDAIVESALFRRHSLPSPNGNAFALTLPDTSLALLSQGDHPTLGTPSWYFHPCRTSEAVSEILTESNDAENSNELLRWMEVWFMVLSNVVDFFAGSQ